MNQLDYHIDKPDFLVLYQQARMTALIEKNIKCAFQTIRFVLYNPKKVLSQFQVRIPSPRLQPQLKGPESQLPLQTPHNIAELDTQAEALQEDSEPNRPSATLFGQGMPIRDTQCSPSCR